MKVRRFTLLVEDTKPLFDWLEDHGADHVVRQQAMSTSDPVWLMKIALDNLEVAERFEERWGYATATLDRHRTFLKQRLIR